MKLRFIIFRDKDDLMDFIEESGEYLGSTLLNGQYRYVVRGRIVLFSYEVNVVEVECFDAS